MKMNKKRILLMLVALVLVVCGAMGGTTLAFLLDTTAPVKNTFTAGDVDIELAETDTTFTEGVNTNSFKMVPGSTISKDPKVTVKADSEKCYVFVKVEESTNLDNFITYSVDTGWAALDATNNPGVYYKVVEDTEADQKIAVLTGNTVTVKTEVTKANMDALTDETLPTLTFTAYACQFDNVDSATAAWDKVYPVV